MKVRFLKLKNWLLLSAMSLLGLASCGGSKQAAQQPKSEPAPDKGKAEVQPRDEIRLMYGVPTMNFRVSGRVTSPKGKPVANMRVTMLEPGIEVQADTIVGDPQRVEAFLETKGVRTDKEGRFELNASGRPAQEVRLFVDDTDGKQNGSYRNQVVNIDVGSGKLDTQGASGWNKGTVSNEVSIKLEDK